MADNSRMEQAEIARDSARVVTSRLEPSFDTAGLKIIDKDRDGNFRALSRNKKEYSLELGEHVPAEIVITPEGRRYIHGHPGILRKIAEGDIQPFQIIQRGASSIVIHTLKDPDIITKFLRFNPYISGRPGTLAPELLTLRVPTETGIDHLYWKLTLQQAGVRVPKQFLATRDMVTEEYIRGRNLQDLLNEFNTTSAIDPSLALKSLRVIRRFTFEMEGQVLEWLKLHAPDQYEKMDQNRVIVDIAPCRNWVLNARVDTQQFSNLSDEEKLDYLKKHAVLIDPFAKHKELSPEEARQWHHSIPKYATDNTTAPGQTAEDDDNSPVSEPAFILQYRKVAQERGIHGIPSSDLTPFTRVDGLTVIWNGNVRRTIPTNLDPEEFRRRIKEVGFYDENGGKIAFVGTNGRKYVGDATAANKAVLEKAGYKKGTVGVELSHGEELAA